ncbi:hypothetical protein BR93DRAFT_552696 [Coniochaeta sp. PMI_546]|nr:hypothetical protein BR93DRAFT_552696 [Coniochaeta sp. PMI_546]
MESSYDPVFHQSGSSTPMSPDVPSGPASQYKANVNRTKTRKWVEAKTVDYGGDDWGGDYDDEPAEPEPQSQPPPKPHGPRSTAALSNSQPPSPAGPRPLQTTGLTARQASPAVSSSPGLRTPVGAPALHIQTQQHSAAQPPTIDTESPWRQGPPSRGSTPGIERQREMSPHVVGVPQSATTSSVYSAVAEFGQLYGDRGASPGPFQGQRQRTMSPGPQSASSSVPARFPRRKSSLGQHDAPADTVYSPTQEGSTRQIGSRPGSSHTNAGPIMSPNKPWMVEETVGGPRSASPSGSMRSPTTTGKPLPFVRPADIYKKLEEEKEKVRRSVDSGRPSMDSLGLGRGSETASNLRAQSPAGTSQNTRQTHEQGQVQPDSDATSPGLTRVADVPFTEEVPVESKEGKESALRRDNDETITPRGARPGLPTVAERKSEYGIEGLIASYEARGGTSGDTSQPDASPLARTAELGSVPASQRTVPARSSATSRQTPRSEIVETRVDQVQGARELPELDKTEGVTRDESRGSGHPQEKGGKEAQKGDQVEDLQKMQSGEELRRLSTSPKLPELGRLSVFGLDLFSSSAASDPATSSSSLNLSTSSPPPPVPAIPSSHTILSPSSPLSTVLESPSSSSTPPQQDASLVQTRQAQGQTSGDQARAGVGPRSEPPSPADPLPRSHNSSPDATPTVHPDEHRDQHRHSHTAKPDPDAGTSTEQSSTGDRAAAAAAAAAPSSERPQAGPKNFTALHAGSDPVTSKSESEQPPSVDKALPELPSEVSVVTPDPQASQLAISAPIPIAPSQQGSAEGDGINASSTTDSKLTLHPLLLQHSEQGKAIPSQVSASSSSQAISAPVPSSTPALKLPPVDDQASAPPKVPGPLVTDYQSYDASSSDNVTVPSLQSPTNRLSDDGDGEPTMPKKQLVQGSFARDDSDDIVTSPAQPSTAPPPPPVEMSRGETYMTALESPLSESASPTKSDKLSAEILQSLSPAAPHTTAVVEPADGGNPSSEGPSGAARESSFLPDLYDDYWSFAGAGNASDTNAPPAVPTVPTSTVSDAVPAALNVQSDDARPMSLAVADDDAVRKTQQSPLSSAPAATPRSSVDVFKTDVQAVTVELHRPVLSNRFSWERDGIEAAKVDIQVEPKSLADKSQTTAPVSTLSTEPASVGPAMNVKLPDPISEVTGTPSPAPAYEDKGKGVAQSRSPSPSFSFQQSTATLPPATLGNAVAESSSQGSRVHPGPLSSNPVMTFREILEEPLQTDRIREFNKARSHYAAADTGLETILEHLATQHPDIVAASRAGGATSEVYTHDMPSVQDVGGLLSPTALGTTPPSARHHSHTTAHLGPKTKEFFATAGKASKGLFSTLKAKGKKVAN